MHVGSPDTVMATLYHGFDSHTHNYIHNYIDMNKEYDEMELSELAKQLA